MNGFAAVLTAAWLNLFIVPGAVVHATELQVAAVPPVDLKQAAAMPAEVDTPAAAGPLFDASARPGKTEGFTIKPIPGWVKPVPAFDPMLESTFKGRNGYHGRLHDFQYNGLQQGKSQAFHADEYLLTNRYGVENYSSIEISYDPSYQRLQLHELWIRRGDEIIDKLPTARFDLLRTESDRAELVYDGTRTLAIVLDDVRKGDMVRYSYTIDGENPIYHGNREIRVNTELWVPLDRQYSRILTSSDRPFNLRVRGDDVPMQVKTADGVQEIIIDQLGVSQYDFEQYVPSWRIERGTIVLSDMKDWRSVLEWALPMYELPADGLPELATIAGVIRAGHDEPKAQIGAALRWVQEEIRYFGVELGRNSHWPSRPEETLIRRFGDCKDKALLLVALLRELGVTAYPALVNTNRGLESELYPYRMHAFDHVIVNVMFDGESHYIDPTLRNQAGALGELHEPNFGRALVLSPETTDLSEMGTRWSRYRMTSNKVLQLPEFVDVEKQVNESAAATAAVLTVKSSRAGALAENVRYSLETGGPSEIASNYVEYYDDYYPGIEATEEPVFTETGSSDMVVEEQYRIPGIWLSDEGHESYVWIYADDLIGYLDKPDEPEKRQQPYELLHPVSVEERWEVRMADAFRTEDLNATLENEWVSFSKEATLSEDGKYLQVQFRFRSKAGEVAAEDLVDYSRAIDEINDLASFYIEDRPSMGAALGAATSDIANDLTKTGALHPVALGLIILLVPRLVRPVRRGVR